MDDELDEDGDDDHRFDNEQAAMIEEMHSQQINVKSFDLQPPVQAASAAASSSMAVASKRASGIGGGIGSGIGSGIGGGLRKPTMLKKPSSSSSMGTGTTANAPSGLGGAGGIPGPRATNVRNGDHHPASNATAQRPGAGSSPRNKGVSPKNVNGTGTSNTQQPASRLLK